MRVASTTALKYCWDQAPTQHLSCSHSRNLKMTFLSRRIERIGHNGGRVTGQHSYVYQVVRKPYWKKLKRHWCCAPRRQCEVTYSSNGISITFTRMGRITWEGDRVSRWELEVFLRNTVNLRTKKRQGPRPGFDADIVCQTISANLEFTCPSHWGSHAHKQALWMSHEQGITRTATPAAVKEPLVHVRLSKIRIYVRYLKFGSV